MRAFTVTWRKARRSGEVSFSANYAVAPTVLEALGLSGGDRVWQSGTVWQCPGCGDRTLKTEEFLEGLRLAQESLEALPADALSADKIAALRWFEAITLTLFGCERDRVYLKDEGGECRFGGESYTSRI